jgi:hypothetical protein
MFSFFKKQNSNKIIEEDKNNDPVSSDIHHKDSSVDIIISLTRSGEIDLSVFIDTKGGLAKKNMFEYTQRCAEFLSAVSSDKLKNQIMSIILDQIKNEDNQVLIENIVMFWALIDKEEQDKKNKRQNKTYILPSQVFTKYIK